MLNARFYAARTKKNRIKREFDENLVRFEILDDKEVREYSTRLSLVVHRKTEMSRPMNQLSQIIS